MNIFRYLLAFTLLAAGACSLPQGSQPGAPAEPTATLPAPTPTRIRTPENTGPPTGPVTLRIWLPAEFDPQSGRPAGSLLQERLDEFAASNPRVRLEVRLKSLQDPGGILEALTAASSAAPLNLPDLVALPRPLMEAAALKGMLYPLDGHTSFLEGEEWYEYARQLARLQNSTFGIPFAGDSLVLLYRPVEGLPPPTSLKEAISHPGPLAFPAADPQALYVLNLYLAAGGSILDPQGRPNLDAETLRQVLLYLNEAEQTDFIPLWMTQVENDSQAWEAYQAGRAPLVITWASRFLKSLPQDSAAAPLPTLDGAPYSLSTGWVWSVASENPARQALAVELAEFLTEAAFLAEWTAAAGFLPPRSDALSQWGVGPARDLAEQLVFSMRLIPTSDILSTLAPVLNQAATQTLKQQGDPEVLAQEAADRLSSP
jgi:multiple sugar transport system substrate-binding protein